MENSQPAAGAGPAEERGGEPWSEMENVTWRHSVGFFWEFWESSITLLGSRGPGSQPLPLGVSFSSLPAVTFHG